MPTDILDDSVAVPRDLVVEVMGARLSGPEGETTQAVGKRDRATFAAPAAMTVAMDFDDRRRDPVAVSESE